MSQPANPSSVHASLAPAQLPFTEEEVSHFRESDKAAGRAIILLMGSVFTTGLLMYIYVAIQVVL